MENAAAPTDLGHPVLPRRDDPLRATPPTGSASFPRRATPSRAISPRSATQMTESLAAFDTLPEKIRATEIGFGGEITRTASELTQAALRMSAGFERGQSALAMTLSAFRIQDRGHSRRSRRRVGKLLAGHRRPHPANPRRRRLGGGAGDQRRGRHSRHAHRRDLARLDHGCGPAAARQRLLRRSVAGQPGVAGLRHGRGRQNRVGYGGKFRRAAVAHGGDFRQRGARTVRQARRCFGSGSTRITSGWKRPASSCPAHRLAGRGGRDR